MLLQQIEKWFEKIKPIVYKEEDGLYQVPYLINSPQTAVESWDKLPFSTHDRKAQIIRSTASQYKKFTSHYQEIEEGLWIILSDIKFENNIQFTLSSYESISADYYMLTFLINKLPYETNKPIIENSARNYHSWVLIKPGKTIRSNNFKNAHTLYYHIYFSEHWLKKNILPTEELNKSELSAFLESDKDYIIWPESEINSEPSFDAAWGSIQQKGNQGAANPLKLKIYTLNLINSLLTQISDQEKYKLNSNVEDYDRKVALQAERIIIDSLLINFPSVEGIAKQLHVSSSKLKKDFKLQFGMPMYQYYQCKKMGYAKELLLKNNTLIKDVAYYVGYENISKFSTAFKKHHGCLPSDIC